MLDSCKFQFQPRKPSTTSSSGGTAIDTTAIPENVLEIPNTSHPILQPKAPELVPQLQPQTALPYQQKPQSLLNIQQQQFNTLPSQMPSTQTLPSLSENPGQSHIPVSYGRNVFFPGSMILTTFDKTNIIFYALLLFSLFCFFAANDDYASKHAVSNCYAASPADMGPTDTLLSKLYAIIRAKCSYVLSSKLVSQFGISFEFKTLRYSLQYPKSQTRKKK